MRRFLMTPSGWFALLAVEVVLLVLLMRVVRRVFPALSAGAGLATLIGVAVVLALVNYAIRRRYLSEP